MPAATKTLRPYQVRLVTDVCRATGDVLVEQPTGSGKTVQIVTLVAMHLGRRFSHAVIAAPQEHIEQGFVKRDYQTIAFPDCPGVAVAPILVPRALIKGARESRLGSVKRVIHYLCQPGPLDHAFACSHAALNRLAPDDLPADVSGKALFIDEAHHASADGLSEIVALWRERGGQLYFFTATPYRGDGRPVRLDGMRVFRRSLAEHMADGFAPRHLESEIVALGRPGDAITAGQFSGEEAPPSSYFEGLVAAIARRWREDGKPKAIVRVPPMQGGRSGELVARLTQALAVQGVRILDATGTGAEDKQRFLTALETEKERTHATSGFDVMVGIQRVLEGTDWPVCSAVYCVGMPGSLNTVVQFLGRAMRLKGDDYPAAQRDRARLVFFVPCGGGAALADLSLDHSRHALLTCCFLADHEVGQEWIVLREVRRGIEAALGSRSENPIAADAENEADEPLDLEVRAEVELAMAAAREQIVSSGDEANLGEIVRLAVQTRPDLPEAVFQRVAAEILAGQATPDGTAVREAIQREVATRLRIDPQIKRAMAEAFAVVVHKFREVTLNDSAVLESVGRQVHGVTGGEMREFAQRLREAAPPRLSIDQILSWVDLHRDRTADWPSHASGLIVDAPGETWKGVDMALRKGLRGLAGGSSLAKLLVEIRGVWNKHHRPPLTEQQILAWADAHYHSTREWPSQTIGIITTAPQETWAAINNALTNGLRGLPGGSSLAKFLHERRGVRNRGALSQLMEEAILEWADAYRQETGNWPKRDSGSLGCADGETWATIDVALSAGLRGLPGNSSLARFLAEHRQARNRSDLTPLTEELILGWADKHHAATLNWPTVSSGSVAGGLGETWAGINRTLAKGGRGLKGGSSLAQLLAERRSLRNRRSLPALSEEMILAWADAYHERTREWPKVTSGSIEDAPGETWANVHAALAQGLRGLPGGSSLARLLSAKRSVRNIRNQPNLTLELVFAWVDGHRRIKSAWPTAKSGIVLDAPSEKWSNIDQALRMGLRGLPGGSSLAQVLAQHRALRNLHNRPELSVDQILNWVDAHYERSGEPPTSASGAISDAPAETWAKIDAALQKGLRGLTGGSSLAQLLSERRGFRNKSRLPSISVNQIRSWIEAHHQRTGKWPTAVSGPIQNAPGETWCGVNNALRKGHRGLPGDTSLARLIGEHRRERQP
jgi:superfamily II DNA or RNA helicase